MDFCEISVIIYNCLKYARRCSIALHASMIKIQQSYQSYIPTCLLTYLSWSYFQEVYEVNSAIAGQVLWRFHRFNLLPLEWLIDWLIKWWFTVCKTESSIYAKCAVGNRLLRLRVANETQCTIPKLLIQFAVKPSSYTNATNGYLIAWQ